MLEALIIQTIDRYNYSFMLSGEPVSTNLFADIIGESVPPALIDMLCGKFMRLSSGDLSDFANTSDAQITLFT